MSRNNNTQQKNQAQPTNTASKQAFDIKQLAERVFQKVSADLQSLDEGLVQLESYVKSIDCSLYLTVGRFEYSPGHIANLVEGEGGSLSIRLGHRHHAGGLTGVDLASRESSTLARIDILQDEGITIVAGQQRRVSCSAPDVGTVFAELVVENSLFPALNLYKVLVREGL